MGCNDGVMLTRLWQAGYEAVGVDPAVEVVQELVAQGKPVHVAFFDTRLAATLLKQYGAFDLFLASNSFAHVDDMREILRAVKMILKPTTGRAVIEVHYGQTLLEESQFDFIYHEHMSYYTVSSFKRMVEHDMGLTLVDVNLIPLHGTSLRLVVQNVSPSPATERSPQVYQLLQKEATLCYLETYHRFSDQVAAWTEAMDQLFKTLPREAVIYGYGASGRANTLCALYQFPLQAVVDDAPSKVGCYMPRSRWPICPTSHLYGPGRVPDYVVLLAWPYAATITAAHPKFQGRFIVPLPVPRIM
jgi:hypothetical protein